MKIKVFSVFFESVYDADCNQTISNFFDEHEARVEFGRLRLMIDDEFGDDDGWQVEDDEDHFCMFLDGEYVLNHALVRIVQTEVETSQSFLRAEISRSDELMFNELVNSAIEKSLFVPNSHIRTVFSDDSIEYLDFKQLLEYNCYIPSIACYNGDGCPDNYEISGIVRYKTEGGSFTTELLSSDYILIDIDDVLSGELEYVNEALTILLADKSDE